MTAARAFIRDRRTQVADYLGTAAPATDPTLESTALPALSTAGCPTTEPAPTPATQPDPVPPVASPAPAAEQAGGILAATVQRLHPRRFTARVTRGRRPYRFRTSGSLLPPEQLDPRAACKGRVVVRVMAAGRTVSLRRLRLRADCTFAATVRLSDASPFAGREKLNVRVRVRGRPRAAAALGAALDGGGQTEGCGSCPTRLSSTWRNSASPARGGHAAERLIRATEPELEPHVASGMLAYGRYRYRYATGREGEWFRIGLASPSNTSRCTSSREYKGGGYLAERYRERLPKANIGKSCVRFKRLADVDVNVLREMVAECGRLPPGRRGCAASAARLASERDRASFFPRHLSGSPARTGKRR